MKNLWLFLVSVSLLFFGGCASMSDTVTTTITKTTGEVVTTVAGSSIAKEQAVHTTLQADVVGYYKAIAKSGAKMEVAGYQEVINPDGSKLYLPLMTASFIEAPKRNTNLPTEPSVHPAWKTGEKLISAGLWAFGIHEAANVFESAMNRPAYEFGDNANVQNSINRTEGDQSFSGAVQSQTCETGDCGEPEQYFEDGKCLVGPDCSCDSFEAGECTP